MIPNISKATRTIRDRLAHKFHHLSFKKILEIFRSHGLAFVIIVIGWEIIEDVVFPLLFIGLGKYVHPVFYGGIPVAWLLCLHWLMVPILWGMWMKINGRTFKDDNSHCNHH